MFNHVQKTLLCLCIQLGISTALLHEVKVIEIYAKSNQLHFLNYCA